MDDISEKDIVNTSLGQDAQLEGIKIEYEMDGTQKMIRESEQLIHVAVQELQKHVRIYNQEISKRAQKEKK